MDLRQSNGGTGPNTNSIRADNASLRINVDLGQALLVAQTGFSAFKAANRHDDSDFTPAPVLDFINDEQSTQWSQELRFSAPLGAQFTYTVGAYLQRTDYQTQPGFTVQGSVIGLTNTRTRRNFDQTAESWSLFGEAVWRASDKLRLIAGARYNVEDKSVHRSQAILKFASDAAEDSAAVLAFARTALASVNFDRREARTERQLSPSATVQYDLDPRVMTYAKVSQAYKAGGFDASDTRGTAPAYEDERVTALEAGVKARLGKAELNLAAFEGSPQGLFANVR